MKKILFYFLIIASYFSYSQTTECSFTSLANDLVNASEEFKIILNTNDGFKAYQILAAEAKSLKTSIQELSLVSENLSAIGDAGSYSKWKSLANTVVNNIDDFAKLSKAQKLSYIVDAWKAYYPQIFFERKLFEDMMSNYRYSKSLWGNTDEIATNFKAIDFYKKGTSSGNNIFTETAVSMKTTTVTDVNKWLESNAIKNNLDNLIAGKGANNGITWNGKTIIYNKAEVHIYMPKEKFTDVIKNEWLSTLKMERPTIDFKINTLEEFIP